MLSRAAPLPLLEYWVDGEGNSTSSIAVVGDIPLTQFKGLMFIITLR